MDASSARCPGDPPSCASVVGRIHKRANARPPLLRFPRRGQASITTAHHPTHDQPVPAATEQFMQSAMGVDAMPARPYISFVSMLKQSFIAAASVIRFRRSRA